MTKSEKNKKRKRPPDPTNVLENRVLSSTATTTSPPESTATLETFQKKKRTKEKQNTHDHVSAKKKKRKKRKRRQEASRVDEEPTPILEGSMVANQMVLIDRSTGRVFSATDYLDNGERKSVGKVNSLGKIELFSVVEKEALAQKEDHGPEFPFETDPDDHCETPVDSYRDVLLLLRNCGKSASELKIYDPYYCNGSVVEHLNSLGFPNVYNEKEDCYKVWSSTTQIPHHILVTNPPYSSDHISKLVEHVTSSSHGERPFLLLMPQWVHKKDYWLERTRNIRPFYIIPKKRYIYLPPKSFREAKKSDVHKKSSPFVSMWFAWGGTPARNQAWYQLACQSSTCDVARSKAALRDLRRKGKR